jgi:DNA uptake protein ComE-like DNA-binding protein
MAKGHWLDPLARSLLQATGRLPKPAPASAPAAAKGPAAIEQAAAEAIEALSQPDGSDQEQIERDLLDLKLRQNPAMPLKDGEEVRRLAALGWRLDVNRATGADWARLPGCRPEQIDLLLRLQAGGVQLSGPEDLQRLLDLETTTLNVWLPLLSFQWYGGLEATRLPERIEINRVSAEVLALQLNLDQPRIERLLRERRRSPFLDLADLQQRLQLPPALVEGWIGRVGFQQRSPGPGGPTLPSAGRR